MSNPTYLVHYNKNHGYHGWFAPGDGDGDGQTEYRDSLRRKSDSKQAVDRLDAYYKSFGDKENYSTKTGPSASNRSANPYVDKNGDLTEAGKRRLAAEIKANRQKKPGNRADEEALNDPKKWVQDDLKTLTELAKTSEKASNETSELIDRIFKTKQNPRLDLSSMSDKEIRDAINREIIEKQYNDLFNKPQENKAKKFINDALKINAIVASQAVTALTIAQLIKFLI